MAIEALISDIGNVIFRERWDLVLDRIKEELSSKITLEQFLDAYSKEWNIYRIGKISSEDYWKNVARELGFAENAWGDLSRAFANIWREPDEKLIEFLQSLNGKLKIYALSNSCPENEFVIREELKNGKRFITRFYFSHLEGVAKPDEAAYRNVLNSNNLAAENCIYTDDKERNIAPAKRIGMHGIVYKNFEQFREEFELITKKQ